MKDVGCVWQYCGYREVVERLKQSKLRLLKEIEYFEKQQQSHTHQDMFIKIIDECMGEKK